MNPSEPRSLLFVPGSNPDRFDKAVAAGADLVCIDLEDAVAPDDKDRARSNLLDYLQSAADIVGLRINAINTHAGLKDVHQLIANGATPAFVMLPKVEQPQTLALMSEWLPAIPLIPIVETARGLGAASSILDHPSVSAAVFGGVDYAADVGCDLSWDGLYSARTELLRAAAASGVTLLDVPYTNVTDLDGLAAEVTRLRSLGMRARAAIHPKQIAVIHQALAPSAEEIEQARRVVAAFDAADGKAALLDGKLIELPVIKAARRVLERLN